VAGAVNLHFFGTLTAKKAENAVNLQLFGTLTALNAQTLSKNTKETLRKHRRKVQKKASKIIRNNM
jgi:hypothetical protein